MELPVACSNESERHGFLGEGNHAWVIYINIDGMDDMRIITVIL